MFEELEDYRFSRRRAQRATHQKALVAVLYSPDDGRSWFPAYGVDLTLGGLKVICHGTLPEGQLPLRLTLGSSTLDIRARQVWHTVGEFKGAPIQEYGMEILTLGSAGRDTISKWLANASILEVEETEGTETVEVEPADVARLIPEDFRHRLIRALVTAGRLAPDRSGRYPTLRYEYAGVTTRAGAPTHQFIVHSCVVRRIWYAAVVRNDRGRG